MNKIFLIILINLLLGVYPLTFIEPENYQLVLIMLIGIYIFVRYILPTTCFIEPTKKIVKNLKKEGDQYLAIILFIINIIALIFFSGEHFHIAIYLLFIFIFTLINTSDYWLKIIFKNESKKSKNKKYITIAIQIWNLVASLGINFVLLSILALDMAFKGNIFVGQYAYEMIRLLFLYTAISLVLYVATPFISQLLKKIIKPITATLISLQISSIILLITKMIGELIS